jgi:NAD(P)-dependent dehydrogenase (short-subunit alcohol dehydrogenase family)
VRDILGYEGKRCVVVGAATGMGDACARTLVEMGAVVTALDVAAIEAPVKESIQVDLADPGSIDGAVAKIGGEVPALFVCAGVPGPPRFDALTTMVVNFVGVRHCIEALVPQVPQGGAIALISRWKELMALEGFEQARAWCEANPDPANGYLGSKQALNVYTQMRASELVEREVRLNALLPCPTDTPMLPTFHKQAGGKDNLEKFFLAPVGRNATAQEMAEPLILLNSDAARFVSGHLLIVDYGYCGQVDAGLRQGLL